MFENFDLEKLGFIEDELKGESERATAIVGAALLDDQLEKLIKKFFVDTERSESLLNDTLTFSSRIKLCECLGLLPLDICHDIDLIRKIRNRFAHDLNVKFTDENIQGYISQLQCLKAMRFIAGIIRDQAIEQNGANYKDNPDYIAYEKIGVFPKKKNFEVIVSSLSLVIEDFSSAIAKQQSPKNVFETWKIISKDDPQQGK